MDELRNTARKLAPLFDNWCFYSAAVPTYIGGIMTFAWATDNANHRSISLSELRSRFGQSGISTRYYNPDIHQAAFALPQYILDEINEETGT